MPQHISADFHVAPGETYLSLEYLQNSENKSGRYKYKNIVSSKPADACAPGTRDGPSELPLAPVMALAPETAENKLTAANKSFAVTAAAPPAPFSWRARKEPKLNGLSPSTHTVYQTEDGCSETLIRALHLPMKTRRLQDLQRVKSLCLRDVSVTCHLLLQ